jgi:hypothetical protein
MTAIQLWWLTLAAGVVVAIVVGALLTLIVRTASGIAATLREVWTVGQSVANNTAHLDLLRRSAVVTEEVAASVELSLQHVRRSPSRE